MQHQWAVLASASFPWQNGTAKPDWCSGTSSAVEFHEPTIEWGPTHLGRFSGVSAQSFGEYPKATLQQ
ncbi:hypothetical protein [Curtobacterium sp. MCBD17_032]|uniref:hypothetical protein n=1 Tax=Curtobacterium sp. MCBD17_032 TaxID=2175659 RepID=UPI000DA93629|nr:hypothetical protein [Curtobacterium sp. MCBD17_032]PZE86843.1 hypothetical protein DEI91_00610 [Curtobacterium sp. MCBD17_032]